MQPEPTTNTSPLTPAFREEPWRRALRGTPLPADLQASLETLKRKLAVAVGEAVTVVDPEAERRYLAAVAARKANPPAREPGDEAAVEVPF